MRILDSERPTKEQDQVLEECVGVYCTFLHCIRRLSSAVFLEEHSTFQSDLGSLLGEGTMTHHRSELAERVAPMDASPFLWYVDSHNGPSLT